MKNSKYIGKLSLLFPLFLLFLGACSSVSKGTSQEVFVETQDVKEAKCTLKNSKGEWVVESTPGHAEVKRGGGALNVHCEKDNYEPATQLVSQGFEPMTLGNILIGGIIGIAVDAASGAAFNYPDNISILMRPLEFYPKDQVEREKVKGTFEENRPSMGKEVTAATPVISALETSTDTKSEFSEFQGNWFGYAGRGCTHIYSNQVDSKIYAHVADGVIKLYTVHQSNSGTMKYEFHGEDIIHETGTLAFDYPITETNELHINFDKKRNSIYAKFDGLCETRLKRRTAEIPFPEYFSGKKAKKLKTPPASRIE